MQITRHTADQRVNRRNMHALFSVCSLKIEIWQRDNKQTRIIMQRIRSRYMTLDAIVMEEAGKRLRRYV